jgi:hypothetical protein
MWKAFVDDMEWHWKGRPIPTFAEMRDSLTPLQTFQLNWIVDHSRRSLTRRTLTRANVLETVAEKLKIRVPLPPREAAERDVVAVSQWWDAQHGPRSTSYVDGDSTLSTVADAHSRSAR